MTESTVASGYGHVITVPDAPPLRDVDRAATSLAKATAALQDAAERLANRLGTVLAMEDPRAVLADTCAPAVCPLSGTLDDSRARVERATAVLNDLIDRLQV